MAAIRTVYVIVFVQLRTKIKLRRKKRSTEHLRQQIILWGNKRLAFGKFYLIAIN